MADLDLDLVWDGKPISQPGIYKNVPMAAYHGQLTVGPSISSSGLRMIESKSPMHYWAGSYLNKDAEPEGETDAMTLGRAAHALLLGQAEYEERFTLRPAKLDGEDWQGNRTACKEWLKARRAEGITVITKPQRDAIQAIAKVLAKETVLADMLRGRVERSLVIRDPKTGVWLKARPDTIPQDGEIVDLKITADASDRAVTRTILQQGYLQQLALGVTCFEHLSKDHADGQRAKGATLLFIESTPPHAYAVRPIDNGDLYEGMRINRRAIDTFARCLREGDWPTYESNFRSWSAPEWWSDYQAKDPHLPDLQGKTL